MEYQGKLYGKVGGKYFDTSYTTKQWNDMVDALIEARKEIITAHRLIGNSCLEDVQFQIEEVLEDIGCDETN